MAVIHGGDALSASTLKRLLAYFDAARTKSCWGASTHLWQRNILQHSAPVLVHAVDASLGDELLLELYQRGALPALHTGETVMLYSWPAGSYIAWHTDYVEKYSLTVYLNREWDADHGGAFCWQDWPAVAGVPRSANPPVECRMIRPQWNAYVLMTEAEWHCVSMTTPDAPARLTLQMFLPRPPALEQSTL